MPAEFPEHQRVPHWETAAALGILDNERATKISGAMFTMQRGAGATLARALCQYALDMNADAFEEIRPPSLVTTATLTATGQLPKFADDAYAIERDDLWAIPTAEVPLTSIYAGEVLDEAELPKRMMAYTSCYRREAGSAGRDTRGMLRAHEFDKVEILAVTTPEQGPAMLQEIVDRAEALISGLGLPYRIIEICTGDMGQSHHRSFDIEVYAPGLRQLAGGQLVQLVQRLPGPPRRHPLQAGRREGHHHRQHAQRFGARRAPRVGRHRRELPPGRRQRRRCPRCCGRTCAASRSSRAMTDAPHDLATRAARTTRPPGLDLPDVAADPMAQWHRWYAEASEAGCVEPNAFVLGTVDDEGWPQSRYLLVRGADERGLHVLHQLRVGQEPAAGRRAGRASMLFTWLQLHRQVRVVGTRRARARRRERRVLRRRARVARRSAPGRRRSRSRIPDRDVARAAGRSRWPPRSATPRCPARRSGVAGCCGRSASSSGRVAPAACTTACATRCSAPTTSGRRRLAGRSSASRPDGASGRAVQTLQAIAAAARPSMSDSVCGTMSPPCQFFQMGLLPRMRGGSSICTPCWRGRFTGFLWCMPRSSAASRRAWSPSCSRAAAGRRCPATWSASSRFWPPSSSVVHMPSRPKPWMVMTTSRGR